MLVTAASITPSTLAVSTAHVKQAGIGTTGTSTKVTRRKEDPLHPRPIPASFSLLLSPFSLAPPLDPTPFHPASSSLFLEAVTQGCYHYAIVTASGLIFQVRRAILPNSSAYCSNSTYLIFTKLSGSLERPCGCRTQSKNRKSVDTVPSKSRPKFAKIPKFKPPYLP